MGANSLFNITTIHCFNNSISSLSGVTFPNSLGHLSLANNRIEKLTNVTFGPRLRTLYLQNNQINTISGIVFPTSLSTLELNDNHIRSLDDLYIPERTNVSFAGNPCVYLSGILNRVEVVKL